MDFAEILRRCVAAKLPAAVASPGAATPIPGNHLAVTFTVDGTQYEYFVPGNDTTDRAFRAAITAIERQFGTETGHQGTVYVRIGRK